MTMREFYNEVFSSFKKEEIVLKGRFHDNRLVVIVKSSNGEELHRYMF